MQASSKYQHRQFNPILWCSKCCLPSLLLFAPFLYFSTAVFPSSGPVLAAPGHGMVRPVGRMSGRYFLSQHGSHSSQPSAPTRCCSSQSLMLNHLVLGCSDTSGSTASISADQCKLLTQVSQGSHGGAGGSGGIERNVCEVLVSLTRLKQLVSLHQGSPVPTVFTYLVTKSQLHPSPPTPHPS